MIDRYGNVNSTKISGETYLVGSGGANDIANTNRETLVVMAAGKKRMVTKLPYITFAGDKVRTVVTDLGIFKKESGRHELRLTAYLPSERQDTQAECIEKIKENVSWPLNVGPELEWLDLPDADSLTLLRLFDPRGFYIGQ